MCFWGCSIDFRFPVAKLLDWDTPERWPVLEASDNIFALVVMAQIRAKATKDAETRRAWKLRLIRLIYDRGYDRGTILELFRVIDWMLQLPAALEAAFRHDLYAFEESKQMPYVTTVERAEIEKGLRQGLRQGMEQGEQIGYRKGEAGLLLWQIEKKLGADAAGSVRQRIEAAENDTLRLWSERILTADSVEAIFH
jgi:flagellar biosynthesis/type III secretory pathway protein FliH